MKKKGLFAKKGGGVGLDLGNRWLKLVKVRPGRGSHALESTVRVPWESGDFDNPAAMSRRITATWGTNNLKEKNIVSALSGHAIIVKRVTFTADSKAQLSAVVEKEARQYIPFDIQDVYKDYHIIGTGETGKDFDVLLVASKKRDVENLLKVAQGAGLNLALVDIDLFAICNSFEYNYPEYLGKSVYLLDIGASRSVLCTYSKGRPVFFRETSFGGNALSEKIAAALSVSTADAEQIKIAGGDLSDEEVAIVSDTVQKTVRDWCDEIKRLISMEQSGAVEEGAPTEIFLSGGGSLLGGLHELFQSELNLNALAHDPFRKVSIDKNMFDSAYLKDIGPQMVVPFGLSLRAL